MSENNAPMKMKLMHLIIETNRQCNLNCTHCMRGDAQDLTITPEIIDKLLDQIDFIVELDLTGGEPFLHPEIIEYLFDGIIKRDFLIFGVGCIATIFLFEFRVFVKVHSYEQSNLPFITIKPS